LRLARTLGIPPLLASVIWGRGLREEALDALQPPLEPSAIPELDMAAERLEHALRERKRILIHGDYDADGISGTAVLLLGLRALGGNVEAFIPNRLSDGYGIHPARVEEHAERAELFITVDCGIGNLNEITALQAAGVEVIITDHHHPGEVLPTCLIVHPSLSPYAKRGLPALTGAGVAYHLLWALHNRLGLDAPEEYSDLATLGTVADVAPLMGENRALVQAGLARMHNSRWPGVCAMVRQNGLARRGVTARDVAFILAPRLNAAGRLGEADLGLELLTTASERRALELSTYLDARNQERRKIQDAMFDEALALADPEAPALVLARDSWHPGVMGIVASKLLEHFYKPVFIIAQGKGSVRSTPGISAVKGLHHSAEHLERYGGHSQAAGFAIREGNIPPFRESIFRYVADYPPPQPFVEADALLDASEIDRDLFEAIGTLEPYGEGHPSPLFALVGELGGARAVGREGRTLQLRVEGFKGVAWQKGELAARLERGREVQLAVQLRENEWQGKRNLEFIAEEVRPAAALPLARAVPPSPFLIARGAPPRLSSALHLTSLPLADDPLTATAPVTDFLQRAKQVYFELDDHALKTLEAAALRYPTVGELRAAYVWLSRAQLVPYDEVKQALCWQALRELELLDAHGKARKNLKRDPYRSDTLLRGLGERYKLFTFVKAYRHLDDEGFAHTVTTLFVPPRPLGAQPAEASGLRLGIT
jgi:single-stranded-DNA-specific exonuclease